LVEATNFLVGVGNRKLKTFGRPDRPSRCILNMFAFVYPALVIFTFEKTALVADFSIVL
jgi:hypothetical protein